MGHIAGKDIYRSLGKKVDNLPLRAPWNDAFYSILKELYTPDEAQLLCSMPYGMSNLDRIARISKLDKAAAGHLLDGLCDKGLVIDSFECCLGMYHSFLPFDEPYSFPGAAQGAYAASQAY